MSLNRLLVDQPGAEIAESAVVIGRAHVGAGAMLAQGLVVRAHGGAVSIGNHSAVLENGVVVGTPAHPVRVGQRTIAVLAVVSFLPVVGGGRSGLPGLGSPGSPVPVGESGSGFSERVAVGQRSGRRP